MVLVVVMRLRSLFLLLPLVMSSGRMATAGESFDPWSGIDDEPDIVSEMVPVRPEPPPSEESIRLPTPSIKRFEPLEEVWWTVSEDQSLDELVSRWGVGRKDLIRLNPELRRTSQLTIGRRLRVFERNEATPTRSIGSPSAGRLRHGLPLPEGPYWRLRDRRVRAYGAENTINALQSAFHRYGEQFPGAPRVPVGEISSRRGGRALPHRSHRTGRDVDLGYILTHGTDAKHWQRANSRNFDIAKNWALIRALVETGEVQQIFISRRLQRLLRPLAKEELSPEEFGRYFRTRGQSPRHVPILKHWDGHRDHMHIRFLCELGNVRCWSAVERTPGSAMG